MSETVELKVPDIGDFEDVDVIEVLVAEGDRVEKEDGLIVLETDKASMDVPSEHAGVVKSLKVGEGDKVSEGDVIAVLELEAEGADEDGEEETPSVEEAEEEEAAAEKEASKGKGKKAEDAKAGKKGKEEKAGDEEADKDEADKEKAGKKQTTEGKKSAREDAEERDDRDGDGRKAAAREGRAPEKAARTAAGKSAGRREDLPPIDEAGFSKAHASPSVRKLARELGVDLTRVEGSGRKGRILHEDVKAWVKKRLEEGGDGRRGAALPEVPEVDFAKFGEVEEQPLTRIQKIAAPRLQASWLNLPHVTQHDLADITGLEEKRQELKGPAKERGIRLTPLAFVMKACVHALQEFPKFNASLHPDGLRLVVKRYYHIGFAADTPKGLVVPVIRDADQKDVYELAEELASLSEAAREGKLKSDQIQGAGFTISSLGGIGGTAFTPIVNAPEVAILGVSRSSMQPVWQDGEFVPRLMLPLSLSYDHRVIDGADAVRFTTWLGEALGDVEKLLEAVP